MVLPWFIFESWGNLLSIGFLTFIKGVNSTWWAIKILESSICWQWNHWVLLSPKHTYSGEYIWRTAGLEASRTSSHLIFFLFLEGGIGKNLSWKVKLWCDSFNHISASVWELFWCHPNTLAGLGQSHTTFNVRPVHGFPARLYFSQEKVLSSTLKKNSP